MKTAITTDSASGLKQSEAQRLGITVIPISIAIDGNIFYEGVDITPQKFYEELSGGKTITTSLPSPITLTETWDRLLRAGYSSIVHIPIATELSSSYEVAMQIAQKYGNRIHVVNNHRLSVPLKTSVLKAKEMSDNGYSAKAIKSELEKYGTAYSIYLTVNTLENLKRSGRISPLAANIGTILGIKPILSIDSGKIDVVSKQRGTSKVRKLLLYYLSNSLRNRFYDFDKQKMTVAMAGANIQPNEIDEIKSLLVELFNVDNVIYDELPMCLTCHLGVGTLGIGFCFD